MKACGSKAGREAYEFEGSPLAEVEEEAEAEYRPSVWLANKVDVFCG